MKLFIIFDLFTINIVRETIISPTRYVTKKKAPQCESSPPAGSSTSFPPIQPDSQFPYLVRGREHPRLVNVDAPSFCNTNVTVSTVGVMNELRYDGTL